MNTPKEVAAEIIELITRTDLTDEQKIKMIEMIIQDYGEDAILNNL